MTRLLARRAGSVVAVDFVEEALDRARENCSGLSNVGFVAGDVRNGLPPGTYDAAVASDVFYYLSVSELLDVLRLLGGSLRPGGSLVVAEFSPGSAKLPSRLEDVLRLCGSSTAWELVTDRSLVLRENGDGVRVALFRCGSGGLPTAARFSIRTRSRLPKIAKLFLMTNWPACGMKLKAKPCSESSVKANALTETRKFRPASLRCPTAGSYFCKTIGLSFSPEL